MDEQSKLPAVMKQNKGKNDRSAEPAPRLGDRGDFPIPVAQIKFDRARSESGEVEAAEVAALVGSKDEAVGQSIGALSGRRSRPVIDRQCVTPRNKTREIKGADGARSKIEMRTGGGQAERADTRSARTALTEIPSPESPAGQGDCGGVVDLVVCAQKQGGAGIHRDSARETE